MADGTARVRTMLPIGEFGRTGSIKNGSFNISVPKADGYRLLVRYHHGSGWLGIPLFLPVFRSTTLPENGHDNLKVVFRILDAADIDWLQRSFGVQVPSVIEYKVLREAVHNQNDFKNVRIKESEGHIRIDFEYDITGPNPRGKVVLEASPSSSYYLKRVLHVSLVDFDLFGLYSPAEHLVQDLVEDAVADANQAIAGRIDGVLERLPPGVTLTLTRADEEDDGLHITAAVGLLL